MKVGDLVTATTDHLLYNVRSCGLIVEHYPREPDVWAECVVVLWDDGEIELEIPGWLEIISANGSC